jgi:integrase
MANKTRGKHEGTIWKRRDKRWTAQLDLGWIGGRRRRKTFYGESREEVAGLLNDAIAQLRRGGPVPFGRRTVSQLMDSWLDSIRPPTVRERTWQGYEVLARLHIKKGIGDTRLAKLNHEIVQAFLNQKARGKNGLSQTTVRGIRTCLRQALKVALLNGAITLNAAALATLPTKRRPKIVPLSEEQTRALLAAAKGSRLETLLVVALRLGLRKGEILGLQWGAINFDEGTLKLKQSIQRIKGRRLAPGPLKTEESYREIPLSDEVAKALRAHQVAQAKLRLSTGGAWVDQGIVFPNTLGAWLEPRKVNQLFDRLIVKAGLPVSTRVHDCRHTCATSLLESGADLYWVSKLLGHSSIAVTADLYGHWTPGMQRSLREKMNAIANEV